MSALFQLANTFMGLRVNTLLNGDSEGAVTDTPTTETPHPDIYEEGGQWEWVGNIVDAINQLLWPILILVGTVGVIYAVYLGVNLARADSADKQKEAKQRMINAIIGLACIIALILLLKLFCDVFLPAWWPSIFIKPGS